MTLVFLGGLAHLSPDDVERVLEGTAVLWLQRLLGEANAKAAVRRERQTRSVRARSQGA